MPLPVRQGARVGNDHGAVRDQEVAGVAVLHRAFVPDVAVLADALEQNDFPCRFLVALPPRWAVRSRGSSRDPNGDRLYDMA